MRIVRPEWTWRVLAPARRNGWCLQRLALRHGYRLGELCQELECSERYLREVFLRDVGLAPKDWMRRERMVVARRMLTGGRNSAEVAERLGFTSQHNFRREFLRHHLVTPSRFQFETWRMELPSAQGAR